MPPATRKRAWPNPRRPPLLFTEAPLNGAKHHYVAERPRSAGAKQFGSETRRPGHSAGSTWVTPEFDTTMELQTAVRRRGRGRGRVSHSGRSVLDSSLLLTLPHLKKRTVCKFPPLSFESSTSSSSSPTQCPIRTRGFKAPQMVTGAPEHKRALDCVPKAVSPSSQSVGDANTPVCFKSFRRGCKRGMGARGVTSPEVSTTVVPGEQRTLLAVTGGGNVCSALAVTPPTSRGDYFHGSVFSPPNVETPDTQRSRTNTESPPSFGVRAPVTPENQALDILVNDTPEEDYGMRVTWRRRKRLMNILLEQGQLSYTDITVNI
ncbi:CL032 protein-like [Arapaima gigas]